MPPPRVSHGPFLPRQTGLDEVHPRLPSSTRHANISRYHTGKSPNNGRCRCMCVRGWQRPRSRGATPSESPTEQASSRWKHTTKDEAKREEQKHIMKRAAHRPSTGTNGMLRQWHKAQDGPTRVRKIPASGGNPGQDRPVSTSEAIVELQKRIKRITELEREIGRRPALPSSIDTLGELGERHADIHHWHEAQWRSLMPQQSNDTPDENSIE